MKLIVLQLKSILLLGQKSHLRVSVTVVKRHAGETVKGILQIPLDLVLDALNLPADAQSGNVQKVSRLLP